MKKTPLKYILMIVFSIPILVIAVSIIGRVIINHSFVRAYDTAQYKTKSEEKLLYLNFPESYLPYYNLGNVCYEKKEYDKAVGYYQKALKLYPRPDRECSIRINLALALCNTIDFYDLDSQEKIDTALFILYKARDVLLENGWAVEEGEDYRDKDAQQLKEDIDKMIDKLKNPDQSQQQEQPQEEQQQNGGGGGGFSNKENKQKEKLDDNKKNAMEERKKSEQQYENDQKEKEKNNSQKGDDQQDNQDKDNGGDDKDNGGQNGDQDQNGGSDSGDNEQNGGGGENEGDGQNGSGGNSEGSYGIEEGDGGTVIKQW